MTSLSLPVCEKCRRTLKIPGSVFRRSFDDRDLNYCFQCETFADHIKELYAIIDSAVEVADLASIAFDASHSNTTLQAIQNRAKAFLEKIK